MKTSFDLLFLLFLFRCTGAALITSPHSFNLTQPDGRTSFAALLSGPFFYTTVEGHTILQVKGGEWQYAVPCDDEKGILDDLCASGIPAQDSPPLQILSGPPLEPARHRHLKRVVDQRRRRAAPAHSAGKLRNIVVLIQFLDHNLSDLPTPSEMNILFNGPKHSKLAPTGSVSDVFQENSYGKLHLESTIVGWIPMDYTMAYYANNNYGFTKRTEEMIKEALEKVQQSLDLSEFDLNGDYFVDSITFLHSGHGAEWGGAAAMHRIWSQKNFLQERWSSNNGINVRNYHLAPARWGAYGSDIARIGVISHEIAHSFGLPDLYDLDRNGEGIGNFGLMANAWGLDGSQQYPPLMSAWERIEINWDTPVEIIQSGTYHISAAELPDINAKFPRIYKISYGFPQGEYLLIENRQPIGFDSLLDEGGLAIYHIDENVVNPSQQGYPSDSSSWPENGLHYQVALLQADGEFGLERKTDRGNSNDLFRAGHRDNIGPSTSATGPYPNTDSYQGGNIKRTGIRISQVSTSGAEMSFRLELPGATSTAVGTTPTTTTTTTSTSTTTTTSSGIPAESCKETCSDGTIKFCKINRFGEQNEKCFSIDRVQFNLESDGGYCGACKSMTSAPEHEQVSMASSLTPSSQDCSLKCSDGTIAFCKVNLLGEHTDKCYIQARVDHILENEGGYCGLCDSSYRDRFEEADKTSDSAQGNCTETCSDGTIRFCKINLLGEKNDKCYSEARVQYLLSKAGGYCGAC